VQKVERTFDEELNISFKELLEGNIMLVREQIREISEIATKEKAFEKQLQVMKNKWKPMRLELVAYKDTETHILKGVDPVLDLLDEDIAKTLSIAASPYVKFMEREVNHWKETLFRLQETMELWLKVQKMWMYLQPIFYSQDVVREMHNEGNKYSFVDKLWRGIVQNAVTQPTVMDAAF
jgi:dynein heavy chain